MKNITYSLSEEDRKLVEYFRDLIVNNPKHEADNTGLTPYLKYAKSLNEDTQLEKEKSDRALSYLVQYLDEFSIAQVRSLSLFIQKSGFRNPRFILRRYLDWIRSELKKEHPDAKAAVLMVLIALIHDCFMFTKPEVDKLKKISFWHWVTIRRIKKEYAVFSEDVPFYLLQHPDEYINFVNMLPTLLRELNSEMFIATLEEIINKLSENTDLQEKLSNWLIKRGYVVRDDDEEINIYEKDNVPPKIESPAPLNRDDKSFLEKVNRSAKITGLTIIGKTKAQSEIL